MKIAIFHELPKGGARRAVNELALRLKKNHSVDLFTTEKIDESEKLFFNKVFFYNFPTKKWKGKNWKIRLYKDSVELFKLWILHKKIASDIKFKKYDYIFVHPSKFTQSPFLLRFLKNKCIYYCQEPLRVVYDPFVASNINDIQFPKNIYEFLNRKIRKWIDAKNLKSVSVVLANSNYSKEFIEKTYGIKAQVCYLGVDANLFKPLDINKSIDVLFIGNKDKGYNLLNESLKLFKIKPKIYVIFRNKKIKITDDKLVKIYNNSKVLVSLNQNEPFGLIPLEAMACGTPVIAIGEGGYKESVIDKKTGFLISRNPKNLYEKINKIINNNELGNSMGKMAREHVLKNWTWDKSMDRFLEIVKYAK